MKLSVPAKLILFGEWAVLRGSPALGIPLKSSMTLEVKSHFGESSKIFFKSDSIEEYREASWNWKGKIQDPFFKLASESLDSLYDSKLSTWGGSQFIFQRNWGLSEGLGSSSALVVLLTRLKSPNDEALKIWRDALKLLHHVLSPQASGLDLAIQAFQLPIIVEKSEAKTFKMPVLPPELCLIHTGKKLSTEQALKRNLDKDLSPLKCIEESTRDFIHSKDWQRNMDLHYKALCEMRLVPEEIQEARQLWIKNHWIQSLKTTGAGGGDALLLLTYPAHKETLLEDCQKRGFYLSEHF